MKKEIRPSSNWAFLFLIIQVFVWLWGHFSLAEKTTTLASLEEANVSLQEKNTQLRREIAKLSSLGMIKKRAEELGLVAIEKTVVLNQQTLALSKKE